MNQPKRLENAKILIANTSMDTDKIKVFGSKVRVDSTAKVAELELAEKVSGEGRGRVGKGWSQRGWGEGSLRSKIRVDSKAKWSSWNEPKGRENG